MRARPAASSAFSRTCTCERRPFRHRDVIVVTKRVRAPFPLARPVPRALSLGHGIPPCTGSAPRFRCAGPEKSWTPPKTEYRDKSTFHSRGVMHARRAASIPTLGEGRSGFPLRPSLCLAPRNPPAHTLWVGARRRPGEWADRLVAVPASAAKRDGRRRRVATIVAHLRRKELPNDIGRPPMLF